MFGRKLCMSLVAASMVVVPVQRVQAGDAGKILGGAILGGIIVNEINKNKTRRTTTTRSRPSGISSAQREENRSVQRALNHFGYNVGTADGALGRKSRSGISRYQADMGYGVDGYLDSHERDFLLNSHQRALASSHVSPYDQIVATQGQYGLLRTYRNEQLGIATPQVQPQPYAQQNPVPVTAPAPAPTQPVSVPARNNAALPDFTFGQVARSANEHCNEVNVLTAANGGITTVGRLGDPEFALAEQFCLARTHAMAESTRMESTIPNMNSAQIEQQCKGLTQVIAPHMQTLATSSPDQITSATATFLQGTGQPMAQLVSGGKVCLGVGYRIDDAQMALASAVLLSSGGEAAYGEMVSHHLRQGVGVQQSKPNAAAWMQQTLAALDGGATPALGQSTDRIAVLRAAQGGAVQHGNAVLPTFGTPKN